MPSVKLAGKGLFKSLYSRIRETLPTILLERVTGNHHRKKENAPADFALKGL